MQQSVNRDEAIQPRCFPPVCSENDIILILGSFPGEMSLNENQYYAHPRNAFWPIMGNLLGFEPDLPYKIRLDKLQQKNIALWDVLSTCRRKGSLDSSIKKETIKVNDFDDFFEHHNRMRHIIFNGRRAEIEFKRRVLSRSSIGRRNFELYLMPSTSPAMAMLNLDQKIAAWSCITDILSGYETLSQDGLQTVDHWVP